MVLLHGVALERLPAAAVAEGLQSPTNRIEERVDREVTEYKAGSRLRRLVRVLHGVGQPARRADDRQRPVAHRIHLVESARLVSRRDEEEIGSRVDEVRQPLVVADARRDPVGVRAGETRPELLVMPVAAVAEQDPVGVERHERTGRVGEQVESFLIREA